MKNIFTWLKSDLFIFFLVFIYWFLICFYLQRVIPKSAFIWKQVLQFFHQVQQQIKTAHINDHWPFNEQVNFVKQNGSRYGSTHFFGGKYINFDRFVFCVITFNRSCCTCITLFICFNYLHKHVLKFSDKRRCKDNYILIWLPLNYL